MNRSPLIIIIPFSFSIGESTQLVPKHRKRGIEVQKGAGGEVKHRKFGNHTFVEPSVIQFAAFSNNQ